MGATTQSQASFSEVQRSFIAAALDPARFCDAMDTAARASRSVGSVLLPQRGLVTTATSSQSLGEASDYYFEQGWHRRDARTRGVPRMMRKGVFVDLDIFRDDEIASHPYYQEFLVRFGLRWCAGIGIEAGGDLWCLSLQRTIADGPFTAKEQISLARWGRKLSGAALLSRQLHEARSRGAMDLLEAINAAAILVDRNQRVLRINRQAERLQSTEFAIRSGRVRISHRAAAAEVGLALAQILSVRGGTDNYGPIAIERVGKRPLLMHAYNLATHDANPFVPAQALLLMKDADEARRPSRAEMFSRLLGLTPSEAKLGDFLANGATLAESAKCLGITIETARSRLKSIFEKTNTNKQSSLAVLLIRLTELV